MDRTARVVLRTGSFFSQLFVVTAVVIFLVGLLIRFVQWTRSRSSRRRPGHGQGSHEWAGRTFADELPVNRSRTRQRSLPRRRS